MIAVNPPQTAITKVPRQWRNDRTNGIYALGEAKVIEITDVEEKADKIVAAI